MGRAAQPLSNFLSITKRSIGRFEAAAWLLPRGVAARYYQLNQSVSQGLSSQRMHDG
jgi:hypothetical protein